MNCPHCHVPLMSNMTTCPKCKYDINAKDGGKEHQKWLDDHNPQKLAQIAKDQKERELIRKNIAKSFLATTGNTLSGYLITEYLGIKSGESVLGTGLKSELSAGFNDILGSESTSMTNKISEAKQSALAKLYLNCFDSGADAVIGVDFEMMTVGSNMIVTCATGTAVKVVKE